MTEMASSASVPVVFFDGEREIDIGNVNVYPSLEFKSFLSTVSHKIGISSHQITVSLICRKKPRSSGSRKVTITEKVNFGSIVFERDCFFLAVLKRSRRERRGGGGAGNKPRLNNLLQDDDYFSSSSSLASIRIPQQSNSYSISPPEKMLLRRNPGTGSPQFGSFSNIYHPQVTSPESLGLGFLDYENQLRSLELQRQEYLLATTANTYYPYNTEMEDQYSNIYGSLGGGGGGGGRRVPKGGGGVVCKECSGAASGGQVSFHWCVYDRITVGFRSPAGPIARPSKVSSY